MARFSERINKRQTKTAIQNDDIDIELRNGLWSVLDIYLMDDLKKAGHKRELVMSI